MKNSNEMQAANQYWGREGLGEAILDALAASGKNLDALTVEDLAPADHFHTGGKTATVRLAGLPELSSGWTLTNHWFWASAGWRASNSSIA